MKDLIRRWKRRRIRNHALKTVSQIENPKKSWQFLAHTRSPWAMLAQYVYDVMILVLILFMFGYMQQFTDYINSRGDYRDRQNNDQRLGTCFLISSLEADQEGQLEELAKSLGCPNGPLPRRDGSPDTSSTPDPSDDAAAAGVFGGGGVGGRTVVLVAGV